MVKVHYSSLRPFTYINVSGTYAYTSSDKLTCEYMSIGTCKKMILPVKPISRGCTAGSPVHMLAETHIHMHQNKQSEMKPKSTPQPICSKLVANMNRVFKLQSSDCISKIGHIMHIVQY